MTHTESDVAEFYSKLKYPGPEALITYRWGNRLRPYLPNKPFLLLDAGCGAGRHTAGFLDLYPKCSAICLDGAKDSLEAAKSLFEAMELNGRYEIKHQSYLDPIGLTGEVDVAIAIGTIHHCPDPKAAIVNIAKTLKPDGILGLMVYSERAARRRYSLKEAFQMLGDGEDIERVEQLLWDYEAKYMGGMDRTPRSIMRNFRDTLSHNVKVMLGRKVSGYPPERRAFRPKTLSRTVIADGYMSPIDMAFDTKGLRGLIETAGLEAVEFLSLGRPNEAMLPKSWIEPWQRLSFWEKTRIMEIVDPAPTSWSVICRKPIVE